MGKKGVVELQFNWIFVIIAGALILTFFGSLVLKQKAIHDEQVAATAISNINNLLIYSSASPGLASIVELPNVEIQADCNNFRAGKGIYQKKGIAFSPAVIKGASLMYFAEDWEMPYKVATFSYLADDNSRFIIVYDPADRRAMSLANELFAGLPDQAHKDLVEISSLNSILDESNRFVRLVYIGAADPPEMPMGLAKSKGVSAINVLQDAKDQEIGTLKFYIRQGDGFSSEGDSYYLGMPMLTGAVFEEGLTDYKCIVANAMKSLNSVSLFYKEFVESDPIIQEIRLAGCNSDFSALSALISLSNKTLTPANAKNIRARASELNSNNLNLLREGCQSIY